MPCISVPTAMLISGGLTAAGGLVTGAMGANASKQAAKEQSRAAEAAAKNTMAMYAETKGNLSPYMEAGKGGLTGVAKLMGLDGGSPESIMAALSATPGYQFTLNQGLQAAQNGYAAKGLGQSGAAMKGAANYAEGLAGSTYQSVLGNFFNLAGMGQDAATGLGSIGAAATGAQSNLLTGAASARAAGTIGATNALTAGLGTAIGGISDSALMMALNQAGMFGNPASTAGKGMWSTIPPQLDPWAGSR